MHDIKISRNDIRFGENNTMAHEFYSYNRLNLPYQAEVICKPISLLMAAQVLPLSFA